MTLARQRAEKEVKRRLAAQGFKPQYIAKREIVAMAREYFSAHPELIDEAKPIIEQWRREGFFGKRAALAAQNLEDLHKPRGAEPQALALCKTHERNGAAK